VLRGPHGTGVFKDQEDPDPARRYKMIHASERLHASEALRFSGDGVHWSEPLPCPGIESKGDAHNNLLWAPELDRYVGFVRLRDGSQRLVGRTESADLKQWAKAVEVLRCDAQNQAYSMPVFRYADIYLGLVAVFRTREDRVHTELAWSPDTITWHRIQPGTPFIGNAATLRPDGWAGYEPADLAQPATILTKRVVPNGATVRLTADVAPGGSVRVSVEGDPTNTLAACVPVTNSVTDAPVTWQAGKRIGASPVALRFELTKAKLYSFRVADTEEKERLQETRESKRNRNGDAASLLPSRSWVDLRDAMCAPNPTASPADLAIPSCQY